jgi:hypothetical protein
MATLTVVAVTTGGDRTDRYPVTFLTTSHVRADLIHHTHAFVTEDPALRDGNDTAHGMNVRGADERRGGFNHCIVGTWIWYRFIDDADFAYA